MPISNPSFFPEPVLAGLMPRQVAFDPNNPAIVYVTFQDRFLVYHVPSGTWSDKTPNNISSPPGFWFHDLEVMDDNGFTIIGMCGAAASGAYAECFISQNEGVSWANITGNTDGSDLMGEYGDFECPLCSPLQADPRLYTNNPGIWEQTTLPGNGAGWQYATDPFNASNTVIEALLNPVAVEYVVDIEFDNSIQILDAGNSFEICMDVYVPAETKVKITIQRGGTVIDIWASNGDTYSSTDLFASICESFALTQDNWILSIWAYGSGAYDFIKRANIDNLALKRFQQLSV